MSSKLMYDSFNNSVLAIVSSICYQKKKKKKSPIQLCDLLNASNR